MTVASDGIVQPSLSAGSVRLRDMLVMSEQNQKLLAGILYVIILLTPLVRAIGNPGSAVADPDVWWHLRTGEWIVTHRACPQVDSFSNYAAGKEFAVYTWIFNCVLYGLYKVFGLRGIALYTVLLTTSVIAAIHMLMRWFQPHGLRAVILTMLATLALLPIMTPRPWLFTILCYILEIYILAVAERTRRFALLLWLVPLFWLWANTHIQFVLGLAMLGGLAIESLAAPILGWAAPHHIARPRTPPRWAIVVLVLSVFATLVNPYGYRVYSAAFTLVGQWPAISQRINELQSLSFRHPSEWALLACALAAAWAIGYRRRVRLLWFCGLVLGVYLGFHSRRDGWFLVVTALTIIVDREPDAERGQDLPKTPWGLLAAVYLACCSLPFFLHEARFENAVANSFPVRAVAFIKSQKYAGPIFNSFGWGGFLIQNLREYPVSMDGRAPVHGAQRILRNIDTCNGMATWKDDPELTSAGLVIVDLGRPLCSLLQLDPRFEKVYADKVAMVFVKRTGGTSTQPSRR
jgi:hypothetical protein